MFVMVPLAHNNILIGTATIMPLLIVFASQFAAHPHQHQRQVRRPHQHQSGTTCSQACSEACPKGEACATV